MFVWIVFRVNEYNEEVFWKIFNSEDKAIKWIEEHGQWLKFVYKKFELN